VDNTERSVELMWHRNAEVSSARSAGETHESEIAIEKTDVIVSGNSCM